MFEAPAYTHRRTAAIYTERRFLTSLLYAAPMTSRCQVDGCPETVLAELSDQALCLDHFMEDVQKRVVTYTRRLALENLTDSLRQATLRFILVTAAKIATIGVQSPPTDQLARGRLLNAMLMLADLREQLEKAGELKTT